MQFEVSNEEAKARIAAIALQKKVRGLKVPVKQTNYYHKKIKAVEGMFEAINIEKIRTQGDKKIILLSPQFKIQSLALNEHQQTEIEIVDCTVTLLFNNLSNQEIFNLFQQPAEGSEPVPFPNSFETAGHIAHYNLTTDQHPYRFVIGEVTLAKCGNIRTVCNKTEKLHNVYRTPILEHMAGDNNYLVHMKEVGVSFEFDFQRVYWCSRLQKERDRVLEFIRPGQCLADLFCGVGPLAVRAARKGAFVIANDLNPSCYEFLQRNCKINAVEGRVKCWNMCAREAVKKIYAQKDSYEPAFQHPDHIYMNLPVDAIEFLDSLRDYGHQMSTDKMPLVHVNCFVVADSDEKSTELLVERVNKVLPGFKKQHIVSLHHIKNVTVIMRMYCLSFRLLAKYEEDSKPEEDAEVVDKVEKRLKQK